MDTLQPLVSIWRNSGPNPASIVAIKVRLGVELFFFIKIASTFSCTRLSTSIVIMASYKNGFDGCDKFVSPQNEESRLMKM